MATCQSHLKITAPKLLAQRVVPPKHKGHVPLMKVLTLRQACSHLLGQRAAPLHCYSIGCVAKAHPGRRPGYVQPAAPKSSQGSLRLTSRSTMADCFVLMQMVITADSTRGNRECILARSNARLPLLRHTRQKPLSALSGQDCQGKEAGNTVHQIPDPAGWCGTGVRP